MRDDFVETAGRSSGARSAAPRFYNDVFLYESVTYVFSDIQGANSHALVHP